MKKLIFAVMLVMGSSLTNAHQPQRHFAPRHYHSHASWVAPVLITGMVAYAVTQPRVVYSAPPVIYTAPPPLPQAPYGYHYQTVYDYTCNCSRLILVPNF